jgi:5-methylcytosine-specific restriction endonuclease McrA
MKYRKLDGMRAIRKHLIETVGQCQDCGYNKIPEILNAHHVNHRAKGGNNDTTNLRVLCPTCHAENHWNERLAHADSR